MGEMIKMAANKSRKIQIYKGRQFMPGEMINAKLVTTPSGSLIDGFEYVDEVEQYIPKAPPKKTPDGLVELKVPFESMREKVNKYMAKPIKKKTAKKISKKRTKAIKNEN